MPSLRRLSAQLSARRVPLVLTFVFVAAAFAFLCIEPPASSACPVVLPKTMRMLYNESALVAVVRVADSVEVKKEEDMTLKKIGLRISSLLKGESKGRVVDLYLQFWGDLDGSSANVFQKGEVLLVFLDANEDGEGYALTDFERGAKKLSPDDLKVYVSRLEELAAIMRSKKPDAAALTEWLVRCAEEPATRWEGAYELAPDGLPFEDSGEPGDADADADVANAEVSVTLDDPGREQAKPEGVAAAQAATTTNGVVPANDADESGERADPQEIMRRLRAAAGEPQVDFAALLTPAQKERLMTVLLAAEEWNEGEQMLLLLAANWKDARLVPLSLKHLARMADKPTYQAEDLMRVVAHMLADRTLIKFVADYSEEASYADTGISDEEHSAEETEAGGATAEERAASKREMEEMKAAAAEARFKRSGKLRLFLALAEQPQKP
ncbi:MAG TPA: hypothetical protein VGB76_03260 [Pyrinomonadaceae bacterium]|jgi:hypothetical protein